MLLFTLLILFSSACQSNLANENSRVVDLLTTFDFEEGNQGWEGGISDFPADFFLNNKMYLLSNDNIPNSLSSESKGLNISSDNPHGDLFYFFSRKVSDLEPDTRYMIEFDFLVYTQLTDETGGELFLKIGATGFEPQLESRILGTDQNYMELNVDKGSSNSDSGSDIANLGSVKEFSGVTPEVILGNSFDFPIEVIADKNGEVWLIVGVDSGIKSPLTFGMTALTVYFRKQV